MQGCGPEPPAARQVRHVCDRFLSLLKVGTLDTMIKNKTFQGAGCPWNKDCSGEGGSIEIGHHPDGKGRRVSVIPKSGHPWVCYLKSSRGGSGINQSG